MMKFFIYLLLYERLILSLLLTLIILEVWGQFVLQITGFWRLFTLFEIARKEINNYIKLSLA